MTTLRVRPTRSRDDSATDPRPTDWGAVLASISEGAVQREVDGELPVDAVRLLKSAGFGALRVPAAYGGGGLGLVDLARLWIELAAVDANLPQAFRGHFALVEDRLWHHARTSDQRVWFDRFVAGEMAGNAWAEVGSDIDLPRTVLRPRADGSYRLDGTKYYTTGTIFAEWADVHARLAHPGHPDEVEEPTAIALVDTRDPVMIVTAISLALILGQGMMFGIEATYFPELFGARARYTGASFGFQVAAAIGGGLTPLAASSSPL